MKRLFITSLLMLVCAAGWTEHEPSKYKDLTFTAIIRAEKYSKGIPMTFHAGRHEKAAAVGIQEYYQIAVPTETEGEITIPDSVTFKGETLPVYWISQGAFQPCPRLTKVNLPKPLLTISDHAFEGCTSLREVTIPENVTVIFPRAFIKCRSLRRVRFLSLTPPQCYYHDTFEETTYATATLVIPAIASETYLTHPISHRFRYHAEILPLYNNDTRP